MAFRVSIGQYHPGTSPLHRLDPRTKAAGALVVCVAVFFIGDAAQLALGFAVALAIAALSRPVSLRVLVGLSGTMCPDVVVACQRMAADNPLVTADVYDVNRFPGMRERYSVMSVPCLVVEDGAGERVSFGKKGLSEILSLVG